MFLDPKKGIEKHRYRLPHWHQDSTYVFITWRLADSLPKSVVEHLSKTRETWLKAHPKPWDDKTTLEYNKRFTLPFEELLDKAHGSCCLREHHQIVANAIHHFDGDRYDLDSFVVMPNHVLLQLKENHPLEDLIHSLKSFTAKEINKATQQNGKLWQSGYYDRLIRSQNHLDWTRRYIADNPKTLRNGFALFNCSFCNLPIVHSSLFPL